MRSLFHDRRAAAAAAADDGATAVIAFNLIYHSHVPSRPVIDGKRRIHTQEEDGDDDEREKTYQPIW